MKPIVDRILQITISKKLFVLGIATFLELKGDLSKEWMAVAMIYIFGQSVIDLKKYFNK